MLRFVLVAVPSLVVLTALFHLGVELAGGEPESGPLVGWRPDGGGLPGGMILASWLLEALALTALFTLVTPARQRRPSLLRLLGDGLLCAWIAWVFRGPLLVLAAVGHAGLPGEPWWRLSLRWFVLYTLAGLMLAWIARLVLPSAENRSVDEETPQDQETPLSQETPVSRQTQ